MDYATSKTREVGAAVAEDSGARTGETEIAELPKPRERFLELRSRLSQRRGIAYGVFGVIGFFVIWEIGHQITPAAKQQFLPSPGTVIVTLYELLAEKGFIGDIGKSIFRIYVSYFLACLIAVPIGILMGCFARLRALIGPTIAGWRYLPAVAFVPLLLIWFGAGDNSKMALLFLGCFWFVIVVILDNVLAVPDELIESSLTMGSGRWRVMYDVVWKYSAPTIMDSLRSLAAIGFTYLVVAEIVAATDGIGAVMMRAGRFFHVDVIMAGILTIGVLGILTDVAFRFASRFMFPYNYRRRG